SLSLNFSSVAVVLPMRTATVVRPATSRESESWLVWARRKPASGVGPKARAVRLKERSRGCAAVDAGAVLVLPQAMGLPSLPQAAARGGRPGPARRQTWAASAVFQT